jgi:hypothetical protein
MTADIEFLVVLTKTILQLCVLGGSTILTVLLIVLIFRLFGGLE